MMRAGCYRVDSEDILFIRDKQWVHRWCHEGVCISTVGCPRRVRLPQPQGQNPSPTLRKYRTKVPALPVLGFDPTYLDTCPQVSWANIVSWVNKLEGTKPELSNPWRLWINATGFLSLSSLELGFPRSLPCRPSQQACPKLRTADQHATHRAASSGMKAIPLS